MNSFKNEICKYVSTPVTENFYNPCPSGYVVVDFDVCPSGCINSNNNTCNPLPPIYYGW